MRKYRAVIFPLIIFGVGIFIAYLMFNPSSDKKVLPIIEPRDVKSEMVNPEIVNKGIGHTIGKFSLTNQNNQTITLDDVDGKVFVAEYFFTTCLTICPIMTDQMKRVQEHYKGNDEVKILSFTVDPETDDVETMKRYAEKHKAVDNQWYFLTGSKDEIYSLARNYFFLLKPSEVEGAGDAGSDFIHTNNFVLIDQERQIRGYYDGTDSTEVSELIEDIQLLLDEK